MRTRSILCACLLAVVAGVAVLGRATTTPTAPDEPPTPAMTSAAVVPPKLAPRKPEVAALLDALGDDEQRKQTTHEALVAALREDPEGTLAELEQFLATADPKRGATQVATGALVAVGTPEIQRALVGLVEARADDDAFVRMAVPTMAFLAAPDPATEAAIRGLTRDDRSEVARSTGHLSLGIMATQLSKGDAQRASAIVADYATRLATARTPDERRQWLQVLGNARTEAAEQAISTQLGEPDPLVRSRAVEALRMAPSSDVDAKLARALDDGDARVRVSAAWSLSYRQPSTDTLRVLLARLAVEVDAKVSSRLLDVVWARRASDRDRIVAAVQTVAREHASTAVREHAQQLLASAT